MFYHNRTSSIPSTLMVYNNSPSILNIGTPMLYSKTPFSITSIHMFCTNSTPNVTSTLLFYH